MSKSRDDYFRNLERCRTAAERAGSPEIAALWRSIAASYDVLIAHDAFMAGQTAVIRSSRAVGSYSE